MSGRIAKLWAEIGADTSGLERGLDDAKTRGQGFASNFSQALMGVNAAIGIATTALDAMQAAIDFAEEGLAIERSETALIAYAGSAEEAARATELITEALKGGISEVQATENATRLFAMGLASTAEEAANLADIAVTLGAAVGQDAQTAFNDFTLMLANQSVQRLDSFGLSSGIVRDRINEMMEADQNLTRDQAFLNAVLEEAEPKMQALSDAGFEASTNIDKVGASAENATNKVKVFFGAIADGVAGMFVEEDVIDFESLLGDADKKARLAADGNYKVYVQELEKAFQQTIAPQSILDAHEFIYGWQAADQEEALAEFYAFREKAYNEMVEFAQGAEEMPVLTAGVKFELDEKFFEEQEVAAQANAEAVAGFAEQATTSMQGVIDKTIESLNAFGQYSPSLSTVRDSMKDLTEEMIINQALQGLSGQQALEAARAMGVMDEGTYGVLSGIESLSGALSNGLISSEDYAAAVAGIYDAYSEGGTEAAQTYTDFIVSQTELNLEATSSALKNASATRAVTDALNELPIDQQVIEDWSGAFRDGSGDADAMKTSVDTVTSAIEALPSKKVIDIILRTNGNVPTVNNGAYSSIPGYANGGDFVVPAGYPNDSYMMAVSSGERVTVTPQGDYSGSNVNITLGNMYFSGNVDPSVGTQIGNRVLDTLREVGAR